MTPNGKFFFFNSIQLEPIISKNTEFNHLHSIISYQLTEDHPGITGHAHQGLWNLRDTGEASSPGDYYFEG